MFFFLKSDFSFIELDRSGHIVVFTLLFVDERLDQSDTLGDSQETLPVLGVIGL